MRKALLIEVSPAKLRIDEKIYSDKSAEHGYIVEHLKYVISKAEIEITVGVCVHNGELIVKRNHLLYKIALEQGHPKIRCVIEGTCYQSKKQDEDIEAWITSRPEIQLLDRNKIFRQELDQENEPSWQIFFFSEPLNDEQKDLFRETVVKYAVREENVFSLNYSNSGISAEFLAVVSAGDHVWQTEYMRRIAQFSYSVVNIVSYQGRSIAVQAF